MEQWYEEPKENPYQYCTCFYCYKIGHVVKNCPNKENISPGQSRLEHIYGCDWPIAVGVYPSSGGMDFDPYDVCVLGSDEGSPSPRTPSSRPPRSLTTTEVLGGEDSEGDNEGCRESDDEEGEGSVLGPRDTD